jgi:hypothetical protein
MKALCIPSTETYEELEKRLDKLARRYAETRDKLVEHKQFITRHGENMPGIHDRECCGKV